MSTDLNSIRTASALLEYTGLMGEEFPHNLKADSFISTLWDVVEEIWTPNDQPYYTIHDLRHSVRIISYFMRLSGIYDWSQYETLVFVTAALIHDIGMQYNRWATNLGSEFPTPPLSERDIRQRHPELAHLLIETQIRQLIDKNYTFDYPPQLCNGSYGALNALAEANGIASAHSGDMFIDRLVEDQALWCIRTKSGVPFRPRLLAGALRLCDELDGNWDRVDNLNRFATWYVNDVSKVHWLAAIFVQYTELGIVQNDHHLEVSITLHWQVPPDANEGQIRLIRELLTRMRIAKINNEIEFINKFYERCKEYEHIKRFHASSLSGSPRFLPSSLPKNLDVDRLIEEAIQDRLEPKKQVQNQAKESKSSKKQYPKTKTQEPTPTVLSLRKRLKGWFNDNRDQGHFELINNHEHTDTFLNCRSLVSDQSLLRDLAELIASQHDDHGINCVLAVGTSAIPLATNVAYRLKCGVTFTVHRREGEVETGTNNQGPGKLQKRVYNPSEIKPSIDRGDNLLIIDDVISGGNVAKQVLDLLYDEDEYERPPGTVYHHSIFRLGNRDYIDDLRVKDYLWIEHIRDVMYASPNECPLCARNEPLIKEEEMY